VGGKTTRPEENEWLNPEKPLSTANGQPFLSF